ncbi:hypothetical protein Tco_1335190 [Tanacetum coccineum]
MSRIRTTHKEKSNVIVWYTEKRKEGRIRWPRNTVKTLLGLHNATTKGRKRQHCRRTLWDCWNATQRKKRKRFERFEKIACYKDKFFKAAWEVIGFDVYEAIKEFFQNGKLLGEVNATIISLVPTSQTCFFPLSYVFA